jgi:riboflavin kinase/FMN adenylyltransferase
LTHKLLLLERAGIDLCYVLPFDRDLARMPAGTFLNDLLLKRLHAAALVVGEDFVFGRGARDGVGTLRAAARRHGFRFVAVRHLVVARHVVSSTRIRGLVEAGDLAAARRLLGRRVSLLGCVVRGEGRGRRLGFPTANLCVEHEALVPDGVYVGRARVVTRVPKSGAGTWHPAGCWRSCVAYVGRKPTFHRRGGRVVEVYFWHKGVGRLRGRLLEVEFFGSLRPDRRFRDRGALVDQMHRDVRRARKLLKKFL